MSSSEALLRSFSPMGAHTPGSAGAAGPSPSPAPCGAGAQAGPSGASKPNSGSSGGSRHSSSGKQSNSSSVPRSSAESKLLKLLSKLARSRPLSSVLVLETWVQG